MIKFSDEGKLLFLLSLFACGDEPEDTGSEDTGSEDTASTADTAVQIGANFYCG